MKKKLSDIIESKKNSKPNALIETTSKTVLYVDPKSLKFLPNNETRQPIKTADYERLKAGIKKDGIKTALHVDKSNIVLAGNNRLKIALELKLKEIPILKVNVPQKEHLIYSIKDNIERRQMTNSELITLIKYYEPDILKRSKDIKLNNLKQNKGSNRTVQNEPIGNINKQLAKKIGSTESKVKRARAKKTNQFNKKLDKIIDPIVAIPNSNLNKMLIKLEQGKRYIADISIMNKNNDDIVQYNGQILIDIDKMKKFLIKNIKDEFQNAVKTGLKKSNQKVKS